MPDIQNIPTTQYIGPRIIPHLWDPILWDATTQYDALAVVQYEGVPYIARYVPPQGTLPTNTEYWVRWADFNAQMAQLQDTVETYDDRITTNATDIDTLETIVPSSAFSSTNTVQKAINDEVTARQQAVSAEATARESADSAIRALLPASSFSSSNTVASQLASVRSDIADIVSHLEDDGFKDEGVLLLGDSYAQGVHAASATENGSNWQDYLVDLLGLTNVYKYKAGSGGFYHTCTSTSGSASTVPTGINYQGVLHYAYDYINGLGKANDIRHVIIQAGVNDASSIINGISESEVRSAVSNCLAAVRGWFPNARVHVVYASCGSTSWQIEGARNFSIPNLYRDAAINQGCSYDQFTNAPWIYGDNASYDGSHPTAAIQRLLGGFMATVMLNGHADDLTSIINGGSGFIWQVTAEHELITRPYQAYITVDATWNNSFQTIIAAEPRRVAGTAQMIFIAIGHVATGGEYVMQFSWNTDGSITWRSRGEAASDANLTRVLLPCLSFKIG